MVSLDFSPNIFKENVPKESIVPKKISENLSETVSAIVANIEVTFNFTQTLPSFNLLMEDWETTEEELTELLIHEVNPKLKLRGLPEYIFSQKKLDKLRTLPEYEPLFVLACNQILDPTKSDTFAARIKLLQPLGVTRSTWNGWMAQPKYFDYANNLFKNKFDNDLNLQADLALSKKIQDGDLNAIKFYKELTGRFNAPKEVEASMNSMNIAIIVATVLEIIAKHVSPSVIEAVADELETSPVGSIMRGN